MQIKKEKKRKFMVISLAGEMEAYDAEDFEKMVIGVIDKGERSIVIDFGKLVYISSSGLRALLNIRSRLEKEEGRLLLASLKEKVLEVFRISKLLDIFLVYKNTDEAMKS